MNTKDLDLRGVCGEVCPADWFSERAVCLRFFCVPSTIPQTGTGVGARRGGGVPWHHFVKRMRAEIS